MTIQERFCPNTGHLVEDTQVTIQSMPGGTVVWWRCTACYRWHMCEITPLVKNDEAANHRH